MLKVIIALFFFFFPLFAQDISVKLSWKNQFQFAGFYVAQEKGFYEKKGLHVKLSEYDGGDVVNDVLAQKHDFGVGKSSLIIDRAEGKKVIALMAFFQHSPSILLTTNPLIQSVKDLHKKRIMVTDSEVNSVSIKGMLGVEGIQGSDIIIQKHSYNIDYLIDGKTDAMASYISNEPYILTKRDIPYAILNPQDNGLDFYGDILFTSQEYLDKNNKAAKDFYDATKEGWLYAFEHIEDTAKLIFEKYNSQNKTLEHLIFEGESLKKLAFDNKSRFGELSEKRFSSIIDIYKLFKVINIDYKLDAFIDPYGFAKEQVTIGVLSKRGDFKTLQRWQGIATYLSKTLSDYHFKILPLDFYEVENAIKNRDIDFVLINTMMYIQMAHKFNISRIATLQTCCTKENKPLKEFGSVLFTRKNNSTINEISDIKEKRVAAVSPYSFGGWVMGYELLAQQDISLEDIDLQFLETHDNVVKAVLEAKADVGTVRTDTLESMAKEGTLNLNDIKIINPQTYENFPFLVSTKLYPEWPLAKLVHTDEMLSYKVLSALIDMNEPFLTKQESNIYGWTIPQDYSSVNKLLKDLRIFPFDKQQITLKEIFNEYQYHIYVIFGIFIIIFLSLIYMKLSNRYLKDFNKKLEFMVQERTQTLKSMNKKLKSLAHTDELTGIDNRRAFLQKLTTYVNLAKRNKTPLSLLSLDIDFFKKVNDNYGHDIGDEILKLFANVVSHNLRTTDIFGRVGGEEFGVCLQNTTIEHAGEIAEKIRKKIEESCYTTESKEDICVTVSIGVALYEPSMSLSNLMKLADEAMYKAKQSGRNQVYIAVKE